MLSESFHIRTALRFALLPVNHPTHTHTHTHTQEEKKWWPTKILGNGNDERTHYACNQAGWNKEVFRRQELTSTYFMCRYIGLRHTAEHWTITEALLQMEHVWRISTTGNSELRKWASFLIQMGINNTWLSDLQPAFQVHMSGCRVTKK